MGTFVHADNALLWRGVTLLVWVRILPVMMGNIISMVSGWEFMVQLDCAVSTHYVTKQDLTCGSRHSKESQSISAIYGSPEHVVITLDSFSHELCLVSNSQGTLPVADGSLDSLKNLVKSCLGLIGVEWYRGVPYLILQGPAKEMNQVMAILHPTLWVGCRILLPTMKGYVGKVRIRVKETFPLSKPFPLVIRKYKTQEFFIAECFIACYWARPHLQIVRWIPISATSSNVNKQHHQHKYHHSWHVNTPLDLPTSLKINDKLLSVITRPNRMTVPPIALLVIDRHQLITTADSCNLWHNWTHHLFGKFSFYKTTSISLYNLAGYTLTHWDIC